MQSPTDERGNDSRPLAPRLRDGLLPEEHPNAVLDDALCPLPAKLLIRSQAIPRLERREEVGRFEERHGTLFELGQRAEQIPPQIAHHLCVRLREKARSPTKRRTRSKKRRRALEYGNTPLDRHRDAVFERSLDHGIRRRGFEELPLVLGELPVEPFHVLEVPVNGTKPIPSAGGDPFSRGLEISFGDELGQRPNDALPTSDAALKPPIGLVFRRRICGLRSLQSLPPRPPDRAEFASGATLHD